MKLRCAILDDYQNLASSMANWAAIEDKVEFRFLNQHFEREADLVQFLAEYQILVVMRERTSFTASLLARLPLLKLIVTSGMQNTAIDTEFAALRGIVVSGTRSGSEPPAELTWVLILGLARSIVSENESFRNGGPWQSSIGADLFGKQLGLLGLGKIGSRVARVGLAFGMKVVAWSQNLTDERVLAVGVKQARSKEYLFKTSDFVSIHLVLSDRTKDFVGTAELNWMKPTAYLINTSRAQIVNDAALIDAIQNRRIAGAGLDVFEREPLPEGHLLRTLRNLLSTPHLGYVTQSNYYTYYYEAVEDIEAFLTGSPIRRLW
jgi:phosphoglycerate dehydrogenase-like enzyme